MNESLKRTNRTGLSLSFVSFVSTTSGQVYVGVGWCMCLSGRVYVNLCVRLRVRFLKNMLRHDFPGHWLVLAWIQYILS